MIDAPSLPVDMTEPVSESSGDPTDTVDTVIQHQPEDDLIHGRFAPAQRAQKAGSLLQQDDIVRILHLPAIERTPEDIMMLAETISRCARQIVALQHLLLIPLLISSALFMQNLLRSWHAT